MYQYIQISSIPQDGSNVIVCNKLCKALQFINNHHMEIVETISDAAGNVTGFLVGRPTESPFKDSCSWLPWKDFEKKLKEEGIKYE